MWCACRAIADELSTSLRRQGMHLFCTYSKQRLARTFLKSGSALLSYIAFCLWISLGEQYLYLWAWAIHKFWIYTCEGCVLRLVKFCINHFSGWINVPSKNWELQKRQGKRLDPIPLVAPFHHGFHRLDRFPSFISRSIRAVFNRTGKKSNYKCNHQSSGTTCTTAQTQKYTVKWMHIFALDHFASWTQDFKVSMQRAREKCYFINLYIYTVVIFSQNSPWPLALPRLLRPVSKPDQQLSYWASVESTIVQKETCLHSNVQGSCPISTCNCVPRPSWTLEVFFVVCAIKH